MMQEMMAPGVEPRHAFYDVHIMLKGTKVNTLAALSLSKGL